MMDTDTEVDLRLCLMRRPQQATVFYDSAKGYWLDVRGEEIPLTEQQGVYVLSAIAPLYL